MSTGTLPAAAREPESTGHRCPLCGFDFLEGEHCSICPMTNYCHTLCCPNCGYSFVERSTVTSFLGRLVARWRRKRRAEE